MKSKDGVKDVARYAKIKDGMIIFIGWGSVPEVFKFNRSQLRSRSPKIFLIPIDIMIQDGECIGANFEAYEPDKRQNTELPDIEDIKNLFSMYGVSLQKDDGTYKSPFDVFKEAAGRSEESNDTT